MANSNVGSKQLVSRGADWVVEWVDRLFRGDRSDSIVVSGVDGRVFIRGIDMDPVLAAVGGSAPTQLVVYDNATRPLATTVPAGGMIFNSDDAAINISDGTDWRDSAGNLT